MKEIKPAPKVGFRPVVWMPNIKPHDRGSTTLSDGATFSSDSVAVAYIRQIAERGGAVKCITAIKNPGQWYDSISEFESIGRMSVAELQELQNYWKQCCELRDKPQKSYNIENIRTGFNLVIILGSKPETVLIDQNGVEYTVAELTPIISAMVLTDTEKQINDFCNQFSKKHP